MNLSKLTGLIAAPFTPMDAEGKLNLSLVPQYYQLLKRNKYEIIISQCMQDP